MVMLFNLTIQILSNLFLYPGVRNMSTKGLNSVPNAIRELRCGEILVMSKRTESTIKIEKLKNISHAAWLHLSPDQA